MSALMHAVINKRKGCVKDLIDAYADTDIKDRDGNTAQDLAAEVGL